MVSKRRLVLIALIVAAVCDVAHAQTYQGRELVKAQLVADTTAMIPGRPLSVGLLLRMVPGWHTYWKFPGDAGIATEIKWQLPDGWKAADIQWPTPLKLTEPGDIQIYGYHDEVLLMTEVTPPAHVGQSSVKLAAAANWLVCERICIPGSASLELELPVQAQASPANSELFERYRARLPLDLSAADAGRARWQRTQSELRLSIVSDVVSGLPFVDFFPLPQGTTVVGHPRVQREGADKVNVTVPVESAEQNRSALDGLLVAGAAPDSPDRHAWFVHGESTPAGTTANKVAIAASGSAAKFLLFGFLGGFILNLMPCVLPVISLKIFGFVQYAGQSRRRIFRSGLAFVAGIFSWFIALALVMIALKAAGREIAWALQFTNPYFVVGMSALVLVFALNLFGVFELSLPSSTNRALTGLTAHEGEAGSFLQGVFATVLATPCTAPFLGTALGFAFTQSGPMIFLMFLSIAAGMSAPYLLLSAQPAWLRLLPKPGAWMERVKQFMGFLLLGTLLFLLWVLGAERGVEAVIWICCFLLTLSIACWMKGAFVLPTRSLASRAVVLVLMFVVVIVGGFYFVGYKFRTAKLSSIAGATSGGWRAFSPPALEAELDQGHPVFIDFTAAWCLTCKFNEAAVLETDAVRAAFERHDVIKFKADWTNADPEITKMLKHFGRPGVPLYVLYPAGKFGDPIVLPELLTKGIVIDQLQNIRHNVAAQ